MELPGQAQAGEEGLLWVPALRAHCSSSQGLACSMEPSWWPWGR